MIGDRRRAPGVTHWGPFCELLTRGISPTDIDATGLIYFYEGTWWLFDMNSEREGALVAVEFKRPWEAAPGNGQRRALEALRRRPLDYLVWADVNGDHAPDIHPQSDMLDWRAAPRLGLREVRGHGAKDFALFLLDVDRGLT